MGGEPRVLLVERLHQAVFCVDGGQRLVKRVATSPGGQGELQ